MSLFGAVLWASGAHLVFMWIVSLMEALSEGSIYDQVALTICQLAGYLFVIFLMLRVHAPNNQIRDFLALRRSHLAFLPLGIIIGLAAPFPAYAILTWAEQLWPPQEPLYNWVEHFYTLNQGQRIAVAFGTVLISPAIEECLFRGALFRPLCQKNSRQMVLVVTSLVFAAIHLNLVKVPHLFGLGLMFGYLRMASGSLWPPILMHVAFNALPFVDLLSHDGPTPAEEPSLVYALAGAGVCIVSLLAASMLGRSSREARAARRNDGGTMS